MSAINDKSPAVQFIEQEFDVVFQSPLVKSLDDADEFLLGNRHNNLDDLRACARFIDLIGNDSVAFKEGRAMFHLWDYATVAQRISQLIGRPLSVQNLTVYGWDIIEDGTETRKKLPVYYQKAKNGEPLSLEEYQQSKRDWDKRTDAFEKCLTITAALRSLGKESQSTTTDSQKGQYFINPALIFKRSIIVMGCAHLKRSKSFQEAPVVSVQGNRIVMKRGTLEHLDENRLHAFLSARKAVVLFPKGCLQSSFYT